MQNEGDKRSPKGRKTGSPEVVKKPTVEGLESEDNAIANQPKFEIENSTSEIKETLPTANPKLPTDPMEVHHHPEVEKKTFKQYLLEGLMIFLAVFMGFIAENIREKISDNNKGREYAINIKKELIADTVNLSKWIPAIYTRMAAMDTLIDYLSTPGYTKNGSEMYYVARATTRTMRYEASDNTLKELKSSGNFRLIRDQQLRHDLMDFENTISFYLNLNAIEFQENEMAYPLIGNLFDATVFVKMTIMTRGGSFSKQDFIGARQFIHKPAGNPQLRVQNSDEVNLLIYYLHQKESTMYGEAKLLKTESMGAAAL
jgi:hypothetical protein